VAGLQHSGVTREAIRIGLLWLDAHPDFNTPETTRSGSLGGMPVAVATGRALHRLRLEAGVEAQAVQGTAGRHCHWHPAERSAARGFGSVEVRMRIEPEHSDPDRI